MFHLLGLLPYEVGCTFKQLGPSDLCTGCVSPVGFLTYS
jgi:hypothetical protein